MIDQIKRFFNEFVLSEHDKEKPIDPVVLATAALLIEVTRADYAEDPRELDAVRDALRRTLNIDDKSLDELVELAGIQATEATCSYEFTRLINMHFDAQKKLELIAAMWKVAYADGRLDKYEEHLIRRIAELIYVPHQDFIRLKLRTSPSG